MSRSKPILHRVETTVGEVTYDRMVASLRRLQNNGVAPTISMREAVRHLLLLGLRADEKKEQGK